MTTKDEVARRVAAEHGLQRGDSGRWYDADWVGVPDFLVDALISSEMRVEEIAAISLGRQKELFRLAAEKNDEWARAEKAEARVEELQAALQIANIAATSNEKSWL